MSLIPKRNVIDCHKAIVADMEKKNDILERDIIIQQRKLVSYPPGSGRKAIFFVF